MMRNRHSIDIIDTRIANSTSSAHSHEAEDIRRRYDAVGDDDGGVSFTSSRYRHRRRRRGTVSLRRTSIETPELVAHETFRMPALDSPSAHGSADLPCSRKLLRSFNGRWLKATVAIRARPSMAHGVCRPTTQTSPST